MPVVVLETHAFRHPLLHEGRTRVEGQEADAVKVLEHLEGKTVLRVDRIPVGVDERY